MPEYPCYGCEDCAIMEPDWTCPQLVLNNDDPLPTTVDCFKCSECVVDTDHDKCPKKLIESRIKEKR